MYQILELLRSFIQPPAEQWDEHQIRLEQVTGQLLDLMRDCRRPHDLQNEVRRDWQIPDGCVTDVSIVI